MTQEDKLKAIMDRAFDNGLDWMGWSKPTAVKQITSSLFVFYMPHESAGSVTEITMSYQEVIFDAVFLQAFFGEKDLAICPIDGLELTPEQITYKEQCAECKGGILFPKAWQYRAQELVLAENRIDYLYAFVETL